MVRQMISTPIKVKVVDLSCCRRMNQKLGPSRSQPPDINPHKIVVKVIPKLEMTIFYFEKLLILIVINEDTGVPFPSDI